MEVYRRGKIYWYDFIRHGVRYHTRQAAQDWADTFRGRVVNGEVGIVEREPAPTLKEFSQRFIDEIQVRCKEKPGTASLSP